MTQIALIDYGMSNLRSVAKACEHLGARVTVTADAKTILAADKVILPGVGAFGHAVDELSKRNLAETLKEALARGKIFLGICLGLQLLFETSEEAPGIKGLCVLPGAVKKFPRLPGIKIPHMGWNQLRITQESLPLFREIPDNSFFYFVHSYYAASEQQNTIAAECDYAGITFSAAVAKENVFAVQFHPEKSQKPGLQLLKNFIGM